MSASYEQGLVHIGSMTATADYSGSSFQYCVVYAASANTATIRTASTLPILGVLQNTPASGQACDIGVFGVSKVRVKAADTISVMDRLMATTYGCVMASTVGTGYVLGRALSATTTTGIINMLITHQGADSSGAKAAGGA